MTSATAPPETLRSLGRGGALNIVGVITSGALGFLLVVVITRGLGSAALAGAFFQAVAIMAIGLRLAQLGTPAALVRTISRLRALGRHHDLRTVGLVAVVPVAVVGMVLAFGGYALAPWLGTVFGTGGVEHETSTFVRAFSVFLPVAILFHLAVAASRGFGTMLPAVVADDLVRPVLQPVLVVLVFVVGGGHALLGLAYWFPMLVGLGLLLPWLRRLEMPPSAVTEPPETRPWAPIAGEFWRFAAPRAVAGMFGVMMLWVDTLMLGAMASARDAGIYAAVTRYLLVGTALQMAVTNVLSPHIASLLALGDRRSALSAYQVSTGWSVMLTWPLLLSVGIWSPVLAQLFGDEFAAGQHVLPILAAAWLVATALGPVDTVLVMGGRSAWSMYNLGIAFVVNVGLNILLIPPLGAEGAAIAWAAAILVHNLLPLAQVWRYMRLHPFGRGPLVVGPLALVCYGFGSLVGLRIGGANVQGLVLTLGCLSLAYLLGLVRLGSRLQLGHLLTLIPRGKGA